VFCTERLFYLEIALPYSLEPRLALFFPFHFSLFPFFYLLPTTFCFFLFPFFYLLPTTFCFSLFPFPFFLPSTYYLLLSAFPFLLFTFYFLLLFLSPFTREMSAGQRVDFFTFHFSIDKKTALIY
jgi:hypothetical protein